MSEQALALEREPAAVQTRPQDVALRRPRVLIVGGGFGGLYAAKALGNKPVNVVLIDKKNHHTFQPLLYQVATTVLSPGQIASPLRHILRRYRNVEVLLGEVESFDLEAKSAFVKEGGEIRYDYLILAAGVRTAYFGHSDWEQAAPGLKTVEDALEIRRRILRAFERGEKDAYFGESEAPLVFAVIGGGPTGVELAGAIADIARRAVARDYKCLNTRKTRVILYEAAPRLLGMYSDKVSALALKQLEELGVDVYLNCPVDEVEAHRIKVKGEWVDVALVLWATGAAASPLGRQLSAPTDRGGRVAVEQDLSVPGRRELFVLGDMASLKDANGVPVPALGAAATQEGSATAANILRDLRGRERLPFKYRDKGTMATVGRNRAVAQIGKVKLSGWIAWLAWAYVHAYLLIGFRNRFMVICEWAWAYFTSERSAPLITGD